MHKSSLNEIEKDKVSSIVKEFLSALSIYGIPYVKILGSTQGHLIHAVPFVFNLPNDQIIDRNTLISEIAERCEYSLLSSPVDALVLSATLNVYTGIKWFPGDISVFYDAFRILYKPPGDPLDEDPTLRLFLLPRADGCVLGAIIPYDNEKTLDYYSEDIIRDLVHSPYNSVLTNMTDPTCNLYPYCYAGLISTPLSDNPEKQDTIIVDNLGTEPFLIT